LDALQAPENSGVFFNGFYSILRARCRAVTQKMVISLSMSSWFSGIFGADLSCLYPITGYVGGKKVFPAGKKKSFG